MEPQCMLEPKYRSGSGTLPHSFSQSSPMAMPKEPKAEAVLAEFQGDVPGSRPRRVQRHDSSPSSRIKGSYPTETWTTPDTALPTWYRTLKLSSGGRAE